MPYIGENLGSKEKAIEYNKKVYSDRWDGIKYKGSGCIGSLACESCFHLISDTCLCMGFPKECPNCHNKTERKEPLYSSTYTKEEANWLNSLAQNSSLNKNEILEALRESLSMWKAYEDFEYGPNGTPKNGDFKKCLEVYIKIGGKKEDI